MKCPIDVEKEVAKMRQTMHPDILVEDAYRASWGAMNGAVVRVAGQGGPWETWRRQFLTLNVALENLLA